ncbi:hypothetical protein [Brevundimonas sp. LjRoot202]|uniref:hypothetical protein n=1 Tax=Brevundimonas sp. LjRoot202 TaxID=3342281 RepID=UPI003ED09339
MKRLSSCLIAASLLAAAGPVAAQQSPGATARSPMQATRAPSMAQSAWTRAGHEAAALPAQSLQRVDLANRVSALIELGRCTEARDEAREAGDRQMAIKVRQLCRADRAATS